MAFNPTTVPLNHTSTEQPNISNKPYPLSIVTGTANLLVMLSIIPPMFWHFRNRNIGATSLVAWLVIQLFFGFINAILWSSDDWTHEYNGAGLCDVQVRIQVASQVALPASFACILRALAAVMDTDRATLVKTSAQRRRAYAVDLLWCIGFPMLQVILYYVVSVGRYYVFGISGCMFMLEPSWLTFVFIYVPPTIWTAVDTYYSALILIRLYRYRLSFTSILASSNISRSRFLRLYLICLLWNVCAIPMVLYIIVTNAPRMREPYSWTRTHRPETQNLVIFVPSHGYPEASSWFPLACGLGVFVFFGFGKEAIAMYKSCFAVVGLGGCFSSRKSEGTKTTSSLSDRAKLLFKGKGGLSTSTCSTNSSNGPLSAHDESFTETEDGSTLCSKHMEKELQFGALGSTQTKEWDMLSPTASSRDSTVGIALEGLGKETSMPRCRSAADV